MGRDFADLKQDRSCVRLSAEKYLNGIFFFSNRNGTGTIEGLCDREGKMIAEEEMTMKKEEEA